MLQLERLTTPVHHLHNLLDHTLPRVPHSKALKHSLTSAILAAEVAVHLDRLPLSRCTCLLHGPKSAEEVRWLVVVAQAATLAEA
jgi:hypothetical protein